MTLITKTLQAMAGGEIMSYEEIGKASGVCRKQLTTYMRRLEGSGYVKHRGHTRPPGNRQVVAFFQITDEGREHLGLVEASSLEPDEIKGESVVARAIRTQPNSVFSLGAMA